MLETVGDEPRDLCENDPQNTRKGANYDLIMI